MKRLIDWFKKLSKRNKIIVGSVAIFVVAFFLYRTFFAKKQVTSYQTATVTRGSIISTLQESGNITAANQVSVGSPTDGIIQALYVKNGDQVAVGQNLFKVKSTATPQDKASALAAYLNAVSSEKTAEANKVGAQATLEKDRQSVIAASTSVTDMQNNLNTSQNNPSTKEPYTQNDIDGINSALTSAQETFKSDEAKYNNADNSVMAAKSSLSAAWYAYQATQDSVVTAPADGTVANLSVTVGSNITANLRPTTSNSSSSSTSTGTSVLVIGDFSNLIIDTQVNEVDVPNIKPDQNATITLDAYPGQTFAGKVYSVDSVGTITSGVVTYNAYVKMIDPPNTVKSGMTASVVIQTNRKDSALMVPTSAIKTSGGQTYVLVVDKNKNISQVTITTGINSDTDTEVTSGLSEGQTVVTTITSAGTSSSSTSSPFSAIGGRGGFGGAVIRRGN